MTARKADRSREVHAHLWMTHKEAALIRERMAKVGVTNFSAFLRKMAIDGYYINIDMTDVRELVTLLRRCTNNLNQYAKRANEAGSIYAADIEDLRLRLEEIWGAAEVIMRELAKI